MTGSKLQEAATVENTDVATATAVAKGVSCTKTFTMTNTAFLQHGDSFRKKKSSQRLPNYRCANGCAKLAIKCA